MTVTPQGAPWQAHAETELRLGQAEAELFLLRSQVRRLLSESEDYHVLVGRVLEALPVGLVLCDEGGRVRSLNASAERMLGISREEARGEPYALAVGGRPSPVERLRSGGTRALAVRLPLPDGAALHLESEVFPVSTASGEPAGAVELLADRTETRRLSAELESQRSLAALGRMAAVAAHEIRNPLGGMSGFLDLLERGLEDGDPRRAHARRIREGVAALESLVSGLMEFARPMDARHEPVELGEVLDRVVTNLAPLAARRRVEIRWKRPRAARALGSPERLECAAANLVRNAIEAAPEGGLVRVTLLPGATHRLRVEDDGPGVDPALRDRLFEPFVTGKARGTGLGLALAARVAESHGGTLAYEDRVPRGARFTLALKRLSEETP